MNGPPQQIFFCGHRVLQLFCHNVEAVHAIKCSQKQLERKFWLFLRLKVKKAGLAGLI